MNRAIFLQLGYAFLPILVFIAVDELYGVVAGMIAAMAFSAVEFLYIRWRHGRFDAFLLFDVVLISLLGGVSLVSANDLFFKLKPAFLQVVLLVVLGLSAWSPLPLMEWMARRYMSGIELGDFQRRQLQLISARLFWLIGAHTLLVVWTAVYASRRVWAFASGGLFYLLFGLFFLVQWLSNRRALAAGPWVELFDAHERPVGQIPLQLLEGYQQARPPEAPHFCRMVHLHLQDSTGRIFMRELADGQRDLPGVAPVLLGENVSQTVRQLVQTLGIVPATEPQLVFKYLCGGPGDCQIVYSFYLRLAENDPPPGLKGCFLPLETIRRETGQGYYHPRALRELVYIENIQRQQQEKESRPGSRSRRVSGKPRRKSRR